jgi:hypothetical protein
MKKTGLCQDIRQAETRNPTSEVKERYAYRSVVPLPRQQQKNRLQIIDLKEMKF